MLSKKMTVSLMSLITIFALAFVATPAMADHNIGSSLIMDMDIGHADGLQMMYPGATAGSPLSAAAIAFTLRFDKPVDLTPAKLSISAFDADGNFIATSTAGSGTANKVEHAIARGTDLRDWTVTIDDELSTDVRTLKIRVAEGVASSDAFEDNTTKKVDHTVTILGADPGGMPDVYKIAQVGEPFSPITTATFQIHVLLSEEPKGGFTKDLIEVSEATVSSVVELASPGMSATLMADINRDGTVATVGEAAAASWRDNALHLYLVTLATKAEGAKTVTIKIADFAGMEKPLADANTNVIAPQQMYTRRVDSGLEEGRDILTVKTNNPAAAAAAKPSGTPLSLSHGEAAMIPANGYYLLTRDKAGSGINASHEKDDENIAAKQSDAQLLFNVRGSGSVPNLESFLLNNGTIDLVSYDGTAVGSAHISEIMWGTDSSLNPVTKSQWIEIANSTATAIAVGENKWKLWFYAANETPPASYTDGVLQDRVGTKTSAASIAAAAVAAGGTAPAVARDVYWSILGKGQSGTSGTPLEVKEDIEITVAPGPVTPIVSMRRVMDATTSAYADGTMASSWTASTPPGANFKLGIQGIRVGTPGAAHQTTPAEMAAMEAAAKAKAAADAAAAAKAADTSVMVPAVGAIYVSEVMFAGGGTLPQWIEISNGSRTEEVNLSGWTLTVNNAVADADVSVGASIMFTIPEGTTIMPSAQNESPSTLLVVTEIGRNNVPAASGQVLNLWQAGQTELILAGVTKRRYSLLSDMAFEIVLAPPAPKATAVAATATAAQKAAAKASDLKAMAAHTAATDMAGNLGADGAATWALPMSDEGGRSSIIRRHIPVSIGPAEPEDGAMMESWALASDTSFAQATHVRASSYYGAMNDVGTPGFRAGGALPVELSHFRPVRNAETGQVVITWSTQSELNNAGFFIKRSQQRDGQFQVINATMVAGAGTTSEKQFYTYTDSTAQPNVVYYYQIEDVSLDGNRQTLTHGTRLRGHIGAAGKLTATWGELKTSNE